MSALQGDARAHVAELLGLLARCYSLCDRIAVEAYPMDSAPLPPDLSGMVTDQSRREAALRWLDAAQGFQIEFQAGARLARVIADAQGTIGELVVRVKEAAGEGIDD